MKGSVKERPGKNGVKTWRVGVDAGIDDFTGQRHQVSRTFQGSQTGAYGLLRKLMTELENGTHVGRSSVTVADLMDRWLKSVAVKVRPNTLECYRGPIKTYIKPALGKLRATSLVPERVNGFYRDLMASDGARTKRPLSARTVQLTHRILSMAFDWGISQQIVGRNPAKAASHPGRVDPRSTCRIPKPCLRYLSTCRPIHRGLCRSLRSPCVQACAVER